MRLHGPPASLTWWTLSFWFVALSWLLAPFIFNPWGLELKSLVLSDIPGFLRWLSSADGWHAWSTAKLEAVLKTPTPLERAGALMRLSGWGIAFSVALTSFLRPGAPCDTWMPLYQWMRGIIVIVYGCGILIQMLRTLLPHPWNNALPIRLFVLLNDAFSGLFILLLLTLMSLVGCLLHLILIRPLSALVFGEPCDSLLTSLLYGHPVTKSTSEDANNSANMLTTPLLFSRTDAVPAVRSGQLPPAMTKSARMEWSAQAKRHRVSSSSDHGVPGRDVRSEPRRRIYTHESIN